MATLSTIAQYRAYDDHMNGGWGWGMAALMVLAVVVIVGLIVWLVRSTGPGNGHALAVHHVAGVPPETPMQILDRRLAQGDISPDDHRERAAILSKGPDSA